MTNREYIEEVKLLVLDLASFASATFSGQRRGRQTKWTRATIRPIKLKGEIHLQYCYYDSHKGISKNYSAEEASEPLIRLLEEPFKNIYVESSTKTIQVNISKGDKVLKTCKNKSCTSPPPDLSHNRQKRLPLPDNKPDTFLKAVGIMTDEGKVKFDKQRKFKQINEFLKALNETGELAKFKKSPLTIVDYGCGNAYLTFAAYHYLNEILQMPAQLVGVDSRIEPLEKHIEATKALGWNKLSFQASSILEYSPRTPPDIALALHACDTASDDALAQGIRSGSRLILVVPCCHHDIQRQLRARRAPDVFVPVMHHGILAERLGDVLTDSFRALILRIMGYRTEVLQFVSSEHTAKNVMIRSIRSDAIAPESLILEYKRMKDYWGVVPYLETALGEQLKQRLN